MSDAHGEVSSLNSVDSTVSLDVERDLRQTQACALGTAVYKNSPGGPALADSSAPQHENMIKAYPDSQGCAQTMVSPVNVTLCAFVFNLF